MKDIRYKIVRTNLCFSTTFIKVRNFKCATVIIWYANIN